MVSSGEVLLVGVRSSENGLARAVSGSCPVLALVADADGWPAGRWVVSFPSVTNVRAQFVLRTDHLARLCYHLAQMCGIHLAQM